MNQSGTFVSGVNLNPLPESPTLSTASPPGHPIQFKVRAFLGPSHKGIYSPGLGMDSYDVI